MTYSVERAKYESHLAATHRRLWAALQAAEAMNDLSAVHDCQQVLVEVTRLAQDSLRPSKRPFRRQGAFPGL